MQDIFTTQNLTLSLLSLADVEFMYDLVNTPHWIEFIGNRYINNLEDATAYVTRIINSPNIHYWVVKLNRENKALGVYSFMRSQFLCCCRAVRTMAVWYIFSYSFWEKAEQSMPLSSVPPHL